jgi:hypothetical protein
MQDIIIMSNRELQASFISRFALFAITALIKQEKAMPFPV